MSRGRSTSPARRKPTDERRTKIIDAATRVSARQGTKRFTTQGVVKPVDALRAWWLEASVGVINGPVVGLILGAAAWAWKGNLYLGIVVAAALATNTIVAVSIGGTIPLLLKRLDLDPAVASGPVLTTVTDMCGFFLVLGLATLMLPLLSGL